MKKQGWITGPIALCLVLASVAGGTQELAPGQQPPTILYSIGDSLTRGVNANLPGDNFSLSWANGFHGTLQEVFGLPDVYSHNQRLNDWLGKKGRRNWTIARNGARVDDLAEQAAWVPRVAANYVTVFIGGNDVCRDDPATLPTDAEFEAHVRAGLASVVDGLPQGGTALVVSIPNVKALYDVGKTKSFLGITSCETLWDLTGFCEAMLDDDRTEADRAYVEMRNTGYNRILQLVTEELAAANPGKFVRFSNAGYELPHAEDHISDVDCFHLGWRGQRTLSDSSWPFGSDAQSATAPAP